MVRFATMNDIDFIMTLEESLFEKSIQSSKKSIIHSIKSTSQIVYILEDQSEKIGCAILFLYKKSCRIYSIAIKKSHQRLGYGKQFMDHIIHFANSSKQNILLEVRKENETLVAFYKSFGFTILYNLDHYYGPNEPGVKMVKLFVPQKSIHKNLVIVDRDHSWLQDIDTIEIVHSDEYIKLEEYSDFSGRVFNLCDSYKYQSTGYYVSLLAIARDNPVIPNIATIKDFTNRTILRSIAEEIDDIIQQELESVQFETFSLRIVFGFTKIKGFERVAKELYKLFETPFLEVEFEKYDKWLINKAVPYPLPKINPSEYPFLHSCAKKYFSQKRFAKKKLKNYIYDLAILVNNEEPTPPSDEKALSLFKKAAEEIGFFVEFITKKDYHRINEFDSLFIRATTDVNNYTYDFSRYAYSEGLVVLDDPWSIFKCSNKIYLNERLRKNNIPMPDTFVVNHSNFKPGDYKSLTYPLILKKPDSSFSKGVFKVHNFQEFIAKCKELFKSSQLILVQSFIKSDYDWRIGILNHEPIFACKYYMAKEHWQIYDWQNPIKNYGDSESFRIEDVPKNVLDTAIKSAALIGNGLYGVDLKEVDEKVYVIEINDNPNVDDGFEDEFYGYELYKKIVQYLFDNIDSERNITRYLHKQ